MTAVAILEVSLLLAFIAICVSRPRHPLAVAAPALIPTDRLDATLRLRRLDHGGTTEATPTSVRIAPRDDAGAALQVLWVGDTMLADLEPADIVTVRAWSQSALACSFGEIRRDYGAWIPAPTAGWELFLVTRSGRLLHLQGRAEASVDLARLTARLQAARVADVA
ncbi:MAG TPA: hypothetical protein VGN18_11605 [Jatrophihabitans sp.]|jgi:hypothetical protein|uniref:hypothetical protein n=1 Tax=Jatrophihabitans sp. TaxID=1932789 RepID=UPI002E049E87|nr:hypothetical protein [Jatrophihabitans sp.]